MLQKVGNKDVRGGERKLREVGKRKIGTEGGLKQRRRVKGKRA